MNKLIPILTGLFLMTLTNKQKLSPNGINKLKLLEGDRLNVYLDAAGLKTVGVGHKITAIDDLDLGDTITPFESEKLLKNDLRPAENAVRSKVLVDLNQNQFDALVSFVFNVGTGAFSTSKLLRKLNQNDYDGASDEFSRWKYITINGIKNENEGLIKRRKFEQNLFNS